MEEDAYYNRFEDPSYNAYTYENIDILGMNYAKDFYNNEYEESNWWELKELTFNETYQYYDLFLFPLG